MARSAESYPDSAFPEGHVIADKYRVGRVLGRGGMGMVLAAQDLDLERPVAIKVMLPGREGDPEGIQRFLREGRAAVKLTSDHVAKIFEVGLDHGIPFLVMEYLDGQDLGAALAQRGKLGFAEAADYVLQACDAIAEAHAAGVIHRDLKPQNLFLARRPRGRIVVKVLDFGISKVTHTDPSQLTRSGAVLGTPLYMAPEQMRSARKADPRTDIWAIGVVLYELVTGTPPFLGETIPEMAIRIAEEEPPAPRTISPNVPEHFERIILRCLRKTPDDRYESVEQLVADLRAFAPRETLGPAPSTGPVANRARSRGQSEAILAVGAVSDAQGRGRAVRTDASWGRTADGVASRSRGRGRTLVVGAIAVAALSGIVAAGYVALRPRPTGAASLSIQPPLHDAVAVPPFAPAAETFPAAVERPISPASSQSSMAPAPPPPSATVHAPHVPVHRPAHAPEAPPAAVTTVDPGSVR
jgi:Protein kinase domain